MAVKLNGRLSGVGWELDAWYGYAFQGESMPNAELRVCETDWGHFGGDPRGTSPDIAQVDAAIREILES